jgi:hypothetical protein
MGIVAMWGSVFVFFFLELLPVPFISRVSTISHLPL